MSPEATAPAVAPAPSSPVLERKLQVKIVPVSAIRPNEIALRQVNREGEKYLGIRESIRSRGFHGALDVHPMKDAETGAPFYELTDGLHRFTAACDLGMTELPISIVNESSNEALLSQIVMNMHRVDTTSYEYTQGLLQYLELNQNVTEVELASKLGCSVQWLRDRLGIAKHITNPKIVELLKEGKIKVLNATQLAKLPIEEQDNYLDSAMTDTSAVFIAAVKARLKTLRDAASKGKAADPIQFVLAPNVRKQAELKQPGFIDVNAKAIVASVKPPTPEEAFKLGVQWVQQMDPVSAAARKKAFDEKMAASLATKQKLADERAKAKAEKLDAAAKAAVAAAEEARNATKPADAAEPVKSPVTTIDPLAAKAVKK